MSNKPKISIIVPVYNDEAYLEDCLNSIMNQSFSDFEVIMIDDGSTDRSSDICDSYCELDDRFIVKHQSNAGIAAARNTGLSLASGKYVMFVDSDDTVDAEFCRIPYEIAEANQSDIVVFCYNYLSADQHCVRGPSKQHNGKKTNIEVLYLLDEIGIYMWNKLYSRKLFSSISFIPGYICEEHAVLPKLIFKSKSIFLCDSILYNYQIRVESLSYCGSVNKRFANDHFCMTTIKANDLMDWGLTDLAQKYKLKESFSYLYNFGLHEKYSGDAIEALNNISAQPFFSWRRNLMVFILNHNKFCFSAICRIFKKLRKNDCVIEATIESFDS